jgi:hypothetical protein
METTDQTKALPKGLALVLNLEPEGIEDVDLEWVTGAFREYLKDSNPKVKWLGENPDDNLLKSLRLYKQIHLQEQVQEFIRLAESILDGDITNLYLGVVDNQFGVYLHLIVFTPRMRTMKSCELVDMENSMEALLTRFTVMDETYSLKGYERHTDFHNVQIGTVGRVFHLNYAFVEREVDKDPLWYFWEREFNPIDNPDHNTLMVVLAMDYCTNDSCDWREILTVPDDDEDPLWPILTSLQITDEKAISLFMEFIDKNWPTEVSNLTYRL